MRRNQGVCGTRLGKARGYRGANRLHNVMSQDDLPRRVKYRWGAGRLPNVVSQNVLPRQRK